MSNKQAWSWQNKPDKAYRASNDVTLSGTFNALYQLAELGMIALFAILSVHND